MAKLQKADFYYGAFLSILLNGHTIPALFEDTKDRRIYSIMTNKSEYKVYTKYSSKCDSASTSDVSKWSFSFDYTEIEKINELKAQNINNEILVAFILGKEGLIDSEVCLIPLKEFLNVVVTGEYALNYRIRIISKKNFANYDIYGSNLADKIMGKDNTLKIPRDIFKILV